MGWTRGRIIGRGSTATVCIATDNRSGQVFAVKSAELSNSESLKAEQRILSKLTSPHIVAYNGFGVSSENGKLFYNIFLEYARGGTLEDEIRRRGGRLNDGLMKSYAREILLGLEYLHSNGTVHCDVKSQNILVIGDGLKITDLGCAKRVDDVSGSIRNISGTPAYMAPEVARGEEQGFPADIWALGCTVIEMVTGRPPSADIANPISALYRIGFSSNDPEIPDFLSKESRDFLKKCLKRNPGERWTASELLEHEFLKEKEFNFLPREITNYNAETPTPTPTSVLDPVRGFWSSMDNPTGESPSSSSVFERILKLSEWNSDLTEIVNWECDETWITVRINEENYSGIEINRVSGEEYRRDILNEAIVINSHYEINMYYTSDDTRSDNSNIESSIIPCNYNCNCNFNYNCNCNFNYNDYDNLTFTIRSILHRSLLMKSNAFILSNT